MNFSEVKIRKIAINDEVIDKSIDLLLQKFLGKDLESSRPHFHYATAQVLKSDVESDKDNTLENIKKD